MTTAFRRRFRFSLRTLFVLVTVVGAWLGYELNWIQQRGAFRSRQDVSLFGIHGGVHSPPGSMPMSLLILGEERRESLSILVDAASFDTLTDDDCNRAFMARRLFPEARVWFLYQKGGDASRNWCAPLDDFEPYLPRPTH